MNGIPGLETDKKQRVEVVFIDKRKLALASSDFKFEGFFKFKAEEEQEDNLSLSIEKFGLLPEKPLIVVPDRRRKNEGMYLVAKG